VFGVAAVNFGIAGAVVFAWFTAVLLVSVPVFFVVRHVVHKKSLLSILNSPGPATGGKSEPKLKFVKFEDVDRAIPMDAIERWN